jgi:hypothetical protein
MADGVDGWGANDLAGDVKGSCMVSTASSTLWRMWVGMSRDVISLRSALADAIFRVVEDALVV